MTSVLFSPITMRGLTLPNRVVVSPMCQYNSDNGSANDWHLMHLGSFSLGCAGLVMCEMTNVNPQGRISPRCAGIWSDENEAALKRVHDFCRTYGVAKLGVQLAHAGRKGPTTPPAAGGKPILTKEEGGWTPGAPSAIPYDTGWPVPHAMTKDDIKRCLDEFAAAAKRVDRIGYDVIELHGAHGYLAHQFLSPLSNKRTDEYGGSLENRMRFALEMYEAVRAVWPEQKPLGMRVSATDWVDGGWTPEETVVLAKELKKRGMDYMDVSTGGLDPRQKIPLAPGYQAPFAERVKKETGYHHHDRRSDRRVPAGRRDRRVREGGHNLPRARCDVGPQLGLACRRRARRRDALCAEDDGVPSEVAAAIVSEAGAAGRLRELAPCARGLSAHYL
jgi:2,4-dienoyl-CoA reductase-like NADH-dependent reductase (Old Yellow Enzyme family)